MTMAEALTVRTAKPEHIWPDGHDYSPEVEAEIIRIAREEITADDVRRSGLNFAAWYTAYFLAEGRWRQRQEQQAKQQQQNQIDENRNSRKIAVLEKKLSTARKDLNTLIEVLLSKPKDAPDGEPRIFNLIKNVAWELIIDKKVMRDAGVWNEAKLYAPGAAVTHSGTIWICQKEHKGERPPGDAWRLAVKSDLSELKSMVRDAVRDELRKQMGTGR